VKRVLVIGSPGAGKTTFSRALADRIGLPLYHLDYFYHDSRFDFQKDKDAWRRKVTELTQQSEWIIDGNYKSSFDVRFPRADTIILLDYPRSVALHRAILRRIKLHGKVRDDMPANWKEKFSFGLLKFIWSYNKAERPKLYELLKKAPPTQQIVILQNSRQTDAFLAAIAES
jgi:adenylate kinase family enzyme